MLQSFEKCVPTLLVVLSPDWVSAPQIHLRANHRILQNLVHESHSRMRGRYHFVMSRSGRASGDSLRGFYILQSVVVPHQVHGHVIDLLAGQDHVTERVHLVWVLVEGEPQLLFFVWVAVE